jgi:hypothetical protein
MQMACTPRQSNKGLQSSRRVTPQVLSGLIFFAVVINISHLNVIVHDQSVLATSIHCCQSELFWWWNNSANEQRYGRKLLFSTEDAVNGTRNASTVLREPTALRQDLWPTSVAGPEVKVVTVDDMIVVNDSSSDFDSQKDLDDQFGADDES